MLTLKDRKFRTACAGVHFSLFIAERLRIVDPESDFMLPPISHFAIFSVGPPIYLGTFFKGV